MCLVFYRNSCLKNTPSQRSKGRTANIISKEIPHKWLTIRTTLQVVAMKVYLAGKGKTPMFLIYFPSTHQVWEENVKDFLNQLPTPLTLMGDFIEHKPSWGGEKKHTREDAIKNSR